MAWTINEINQFKLAQAIQTKPLDNDHNTFLKESTIWVVAVDQQLFVRAAQGKGALWYQKGIKNGGIIILRNQVYPVRYIPVTNPKTIQQVNQQYLHKYHWQLPVELMVSDKVANTTLELIKKKPTRQQE